MTSLSFDGLRGPVDLPGTRIGRVAILPVGLLIVGAAIAAGGTAQLAVIAAVGAVGGLALLLAFPKLAVGAVVALSLFDQALASATHAAVVVNLDDAATAVAIAFLPALRLRRTGALRGMPGLPWYGLYACAGIASSFAHQVPLTISATGGFLALKGILFGFAVAQVEWSTADVQKIWKWIRRVTVFVLACSVINFAAPTRWTAFTSSSAVNYRLGMPSLIGPFVHPGAFGIVTALLSIASFSYAAVMVRRRGATGLATASLLACLLSFRRSALVGVVAAIGFIRVKANRTAAWTVAVLAVALVVVVLSSQIARLVGTTYDSYLGAGSVQQPRTLFYRDSLRLAGQGFPFGVGFGRFGTHLAIVHYSPVYYELGYNRVWGLQPGDVNHGFSLDTYWAAALGEAGMVGLAGLVGGLFATLFVFVRSVRRHDPWIVWVGLVGIGWWLEFLVESIANPVYSGPPTYPLLFGLAGVAYALLAGNPERLTPTFGGPNL